MSAFLVLEATIKENKRISIHFKALVKHVIHKFAVILESDFPIYSSIIIQSALEISHFKPIDFSRLLTLVP